MELNKAQLKKLCGLILYTVVTAVICIHYKEVLAVIGRGVHILFPFLIGGAIAFVLNVPMRRIETLFRGKGKKRKWHRPASLVIAVILVLGILAVVAFVVAPEIAGTVISLKARIPSFAEKIMKDLTALFAGEPALAGYFENLVIDWNEVFNEVLGFLKNGAGSVLNTTVAAAVSIVSGATTFGIGFVFAIYILLQKETLARQFQKILWAYLPAKAAEGFLEVAALTERTFSSFLTGQCLEAMILGGMFFVVMSILNMPYALLMGVLIAFTALIPIFGAFIGCAVGIFLMLMVSPMNALAFFLLFQVLQQIEGNFIYPHVVGGSVGLPSIWVLAAVTIGGSLMGVTGMLVFIPICSVLYTLLRKDVNQKLEKKGKTISPDT